MVKKHTFNLVEILLALGVIMIGVVSLMGLFPAASKVTSDATMEMYTSNAVEEMSAFIQDMATRPADANSGWSNWIWNGTTGLIPGSEPDGMLADEEDDHVSELEEASNWEHVPGSNNPYLFRHTTKPGVFQLVSVRGQEDGDGFSLSDANDVDLIDSRVLIVVWKSQIKRVFKSGVSATTYDYKYGARINMKVSWPAERPEGYFDPDEKVWIPYRTIKTIAFDLINPEPNATP